MMEPILITLDDYILTGGGANGESFDHRSDPSVMLKLYFPGKLRQAMDEMTLARKVFEAGIPTPEPGEYVVTEDGRYGIRFRRIDGKLSYSRATADHPEKVAQYAAEFAQMSLQLHAIHLDTSRFENIKDRYFPLLEASPSFTPAQKEHIRNFIAATPDTDTAIHGDLQFSNIIFAGDQRYFIDLGDFCYGHPLFDVGMVYLSSNVSPEPFILETFHMPKSLAIQFWRHFAAAYFGPDRPLEEIETLVRPYAGLKALIVERDCGSIPPSFFEALAPIL